MTDIAERLRQRHENARNVYCWSEAIEAYEKVQEEAADEIEHLRKTLKRLVDDCLQYDTWARPVYAMEKAQQALLKGDQA